eukprot:gnl/TRDRNA2_/TRDRNA2_131695_c0_seq1.p1 gnl/TRDRNA2_/TRDRNA2_131695_c0~~gnl/TRDRNA2_/TRDRNA2_131695_c0_seq1.p1  ORF type:complete len:539 (+),score=73.29 gnl/TRDRNA2_/TRDRNA2_131695_c0_seq1:156-1619(+)
MASDAKSRLTVPAVTYAAVFLGSCCLGPPHQVALMLSILPTRMLAHIKDALKVPTLPDLSTVLPEVDSRETLAKLSSLFSMQVTLTVGQLSALVVVSLAFFFFFWSSCCIRRKAPSSSASMARRRLTKLRAASHLFPPPFPNGWYLLCRSDEVPRKAAVPKSACDKEFVVFRGEDGKAAVLNAFCPHLGTHLGHGGKVVGNAVVCPYHSWAFRGDGKCVDIPYCPKPPGPRTNTNAYPSRERLGFIFVWLHAEGLEPTFELDILDEIEQQGMQWVSDPKVENWHMHIMEPSQNAADPYHFNTVHSWAGGSEDGGRSMFWLRHECHTSLALLGHKDEQGKPLPETVIRLNEKCTEMWLFGIIPLPSWTCTKYNSGATFQGPQVSVFHVNIPGLAALRVMFAFTPEAPFEQRCYCRAWRTRCFPAPLARIIAQTAVDTVNQDRRVWENKLAVAPRNVVAGDGPFAAYGTWLRQFYSENSKAWGEMSLEW